MVEVDFVFLGIISTNISFEVDRRKFDEMAELDKKRYVEEAVRRMEGWQSSSWEKSREYIISC